MSQHPIRQEEPQGLWAPELSIRIAKPCIDLFVANFGAAACESFLATWGTCLGELEGDETRWISLAFLESLSVELVRRAGSEKIIERCGRLAATRPYIGAVYPLARVLISPGKLYRSLPKLTPTLNKINRVEVQQASRGQATVTFYQSEIQETTPHVCTGRKAQLAAVPTIWNLPQAHIEESECFHKGGTCCRYQIRWRERVPAVGSFFGIAISLLIYFFVPSNLLNQGTLFLLLIAGFALGLAIDRTRTGLEAHRFAAEQNRGLSELLSASERQFQKLLETQQQHNEAKSQVSQLASQLVQAQKLEVIGLLAGGIAHDFNNLITIIHSYATMMDEELEAESPFKEDLHEIKNASERATHLTRQLLAFGRKQILEPRALDINQVIVGLERLLQRLLGEDIDFQTRLAPQNPTVYADPGQLEQVLMNLSVNARDAMPNGGRLTIQTDTIAFGEDSPPPPPLKKGAYVIITVTDSGEGMTPEVCERIFEPFFTTKEKGRGTGLGLSTVYGIVLQSDGRISVTSQPGEGASFEVLLPSIDQKPEHQPVSIAPLASCGRGGTILLAEDEPPLRELLCRLLESAGYQVIVAANGLEAVQAFQQQKTDIDLLLSDVIMPQMGGRELAVELRHEAPELPILFMSGYTHTSLDSKTIEALNAQFIAKPFSTKQLLIQLQKMLQHKAPPSAQEDQLTDI